MKANELLKEDPNLHLTHLEDLALFQGKEGASKAIEYLNNLAELASSGSSKKFNGLTIKWDGSPAIFCGKDPADGKFFVGTKGVFNKDAKLNKTPEDVDANHADTVQKGETKDKSGLRQKLKVALAELSKLGIEGVLQGDLLFTPGDLKTISYKGESYVAFKPNTITYAVPVGSDTAEKMQNAKIGVVFHTSYSGESLDSMTASFDVDISGLQKTSSVWFDDAYIKDYTGIVNLTTGEFQSIQKAIGEAKKHLQQAGDIFSWFDSTGIDAKKLKELIHANHNNMIRAGAIEQDPASFFNNFASDYEQRIEKDIEKLKTGREGPAGQRKLVALEQWKKAYFANKNNIESWYSLWLKLTAIKNTIYQKLKNIKAIDAFEIEGDEYVVRDQEGFVAVDRVGKAIKIVDRLDFSRKNFAKEGLDLSFVNTITESRAFRSRQDLGNYTANDIGNIIYAYFLGLILMHNEFKYKRMSQQYASRTGSYGNFNFFRNNGTDLYLLIHSLMGTGSIVQFKNDESSKRYIDRLQANAMSMREMLSILARSDLPDLTRILLRFERELKVNESVLKKVRRLVTDYNKLKQKERQNIVIKIEQYLRGSVPKSELYGILQSMAKERQLKNRVTVDQKKLPKNVAVGAKR